MKIAHVTFSSDGSFGPQEDGAKPLACPLCREGFLHHMRVEIYSREEDSKVGLCVITERQEYVATGGKTMDENPSPRRDGLRIQFECESCGYVDPFVVIQHKGRTYLGWERP